MDENGETHMVACQVQAPLLALVPLPSFTMDEAAVRFSMRLDLMGKEMIAVDGSKFKAWNCKGRNYTKGKLDDRISRIEEKIAAYLEELDKLDA